MLLSRLSTREIWLQKEKKKKKKYEHIFDYFLKSWVTTKINWYREALHLSVQN